MVLAEVVVSGDSWCVCVRDTHRERKHVDGVPYVSPSVLESDLGAGVSCSASGDGGGVGGSGVRGRV